MGVKPFPVSVPRRGPAFELMARLCGIPPDAVTVESGLFINAPRSWPFMRASEVPDELLQSWLGAAAENTLSVEHVVEMGQLTETQLSTLFSLLRDAVAPVLRQRDGLRLWWALTPSQRSMALAREGGVHVGSLSRAARDCLEDALAGAGYDAVDAAESDLVASLTAREFRLHLQRNDGGRQDLVRLGRPMPSQ